MDGALKSDDFDPGDGISATEPDWSREAPRRLWDPSRRLLKALRGYQRAATRTGPGGSIARRWHAVWHLLWSVVTQTEIPLTCRIEGGLKLPHPNGIVIHPKARIGPNCLIFQQVTIGGVADKDGAAVIGGRVDIGAGAKILGPVRIGQHSLIGANSVVTRDVPDGHIASGLPATCKPRRPSGGADE